MKNKAIIPLFGMVFISQVTASLAQNLTVFCIGGQGPTTSTNTIIRSLPISKAPILIRNIKIYNTSGAIIYNGLPPGVPTTLNSGAITSFTTKNIIPANSGILTTSITYFTFDISSFYAVAAVLESDSAGRVISRDTNRCVQ